MTPSSKRAAAIGIVNGFGNIGNMYVFILELRTESWPPLLILPSEWAHIRGKLPGDLNTTNRWPSRSVDL